MVYPDSSTREYIIDSTLLLLSILSTAADTHLFISTYKFISTALFRADPHF